MKTFLCAIIVFFYAVNIYAYTSNVSVVRAPRPSFTLPKGENIELNGPFLEFRWSVSQKPVYQDGRYIFKIYKGYNTVASNKICGKTLNLSNNSVAVKESLFLSGSIYTATLQIYIDGFKSQTESYSFMINKK